MTDMGTHTKLVNGRRGEDGAVAASPVIPPLDMSLFWPRGPVSEVPRQEAPPQRAQWWRDVLSAAWSARRAWLSAIPVVGVNTVAFSGQLGYLHDHLAWPLAGQVLFAAVLESIAVYLSWQAHLARLADDSALRLRLAAYAMAGLIGAMNYSHYAAHWRPTFTAAAFALMSAVSPWLWSVHSRRASRDALKARGLIEPHAVRLGVTRWMWHPIRSWRVMFRATWAGISDPVEAIALLPLKAHDGGTGDPDQRQDDERDRDRDDEEEDRDERQDSDGDSDTDGDRKDRRERQRSSSGSDKVRDVLRRSPSLRRRLLEGDSAARKTAKAEAAQKAGVTVRTVERVLQEMAAAR